MNRKGVEVALELMDGRSERNSTKLCTFHSYFFSLISILFLKIRPG